MNVNLEKRYNFLIQWNKIHFVKATILVHAEYKHARQPTIKFSVLFTLVCHSKLLLDNNQTELFFQKLSLLNKNYMVLYGIKYGITYKELQQYQPTYL